MATKQNNMSDQHLIVHSLKVMGSIEGGGIQQVRDQVDALQQATTKLSEAQRDYWTSIAQDNVIVPAEKKILYKEWQQILTEYASLIQEAERAGLSPSFTTYKNYTDAYNELYRELNTVLKLFDDLTSNTPLPDRNNFCYLYATYYDCKDKLRNSIYGQNSSLTYVLDLTPEMQGFTVNSDGTLKEENTTIQCIVNLLKGTDGVDYAVSRKAYYMGEEVGTWEENVLTVPCNIFKDDMNYVTISVKDTNDLELAVKAQINKLYPGEDGDYTVYDMMLSDGAVRVDRYGEKIPETITAQKLIKTSQTQKQTNYGTITAEADNGKEVTVNEYHIDSSESFDDEKDYFVKSKAFMMLYNGKILCTQKDVAAIFYRKEK